MYYLFLVKNVIDAEIISIDIAALVHQVCKKYNISPGELRSGSRRRDAVEARCSMSWIAVRELGYSAVSMWPDIWA
jgi:chromosomal replication initiation ATPase DnaA